MSKKHKVSKKQKHKNKKSSSKQTPSHKKVSNVEVLTEAEKDEIEQRYGQGGIIKNTLKIWKDSSPLTFLSYFPVILSQVIFTVLWFFASMLMFFPVTVEIGFIGTNALVFINMIMAALGLPIILTILHFIFNYKNNRYYFTNAIFYILPAAAVYVVLDFLNALIAVMLWENAKSEISAKFEMSLYTALIMIAAVAVLALTAQLILLFKRNKDEPVLTRLGVKIEKKKQK